MKFDETTIILLTLLSGACWTIAYILIIVLSFRDKTYGMPFWALAFNLSWELIFSFLLSPESFPLQAFINKIWLAFDVLILIAYFQYGKNEWPGIISEGLFYPYSLLVIVISFLFVYLLSVELDQSQGKYAAFIQNLMMSILFLRMLNRRRSSKGQSGWIAFFKMAGTLAPTLVYGAKSNFILFLGASCLIFDLIYLVLVIKIDKE